jgi:hypothetical protein
MKKSFSVGKVSPKKVETLSMEKVKSAAVTTFVAAKFIPVQISIPVQVKLVNKVQEIANILKDSGADSHAQLVALAKILKVIEG